jgi:hypothetical protein
MDRIITNRRELLLTPLLAALPLVLPAPIDESPFGKTIQDFLMAALSAAAT